MSIMSKMASLKKVLSPLFTASKSTATTVLENTGRAANFSGDIFISFIEKYKGIRRIILLIVLWINIHIFFVTKSMYKSCEFVDTNWVIYAGYWSAILGTFIAFYTMSRVKEFSNDSQLAPKGQWLASNKTQLTEDEARALAVEAAEASLNEERIEIDGDSLIEKD